jgi:hypothetical protein
MSIVLVNITDVGSGRFRLDFEDEGNAVRFVLECRGQRVVIPSEFDEYFRGRTSADDALEALGRFADGEQVNLPIAVREDGFTGLGR